MSFKLKSPWQIKLLFALLSVFIGFSLHAKDASLGRAETMSKISEEDITAQTLRYKIIRSRSLILYMLDILPNKGNPYTHMAEFASLATLDTFKEAQKSRSDYMNNESPTYWLPIGESETITTVKMQNTDVRSVVHYFAQYVATAEIMEQIIHPVLSKSIIIGSVKETAGDDVNDKFQKAWRYIQFISARYKALLTSHPGTESVLPLQKKKITLLMLSALAKGMKPFLNFVETTENKTSLNQFFETLTHLQEVDLSSSEVSNVKNRIASLSNISSPDYQKVRAALESVGLPDSGEIDGADDAFEVGMRLEVGFDIIKALMNNIKETW